jgi:hypothetical protein
MVAILVVLLGVLVVAMWPVIWLLPVIWLKRRERSAWKTLRAKQYGPTEKFPSWYIPSGNWFVRWRERGRVKMLNTLLLEMWVRSSGKSCKVISVVEGPRVEEFLNNVPSERRSSF